MSQQIDVSYEYKCECILNINTLNQFKSPTFSNNIDKPNEQWILTVKNPSKNREYLLFHVKYLQLLFPPHYVDLYFTFSIFQEESSSQPSQKFQQVIHFVADKNHDIIPVSTFIPIKSLLSCNNDTPNNNNDTLNNNNDNNNPILKIEIVYKHLAIPLPTPNFIFLCDPSSKLKLSSITSNFFAIINRGNLCYVNSVIQMLYHIAAFRSIIFSIPKTDSGSLVTRVPLAMQKTFTYFQTGKFPYDLESLTEAFGFSHSCIYEQDDADQFFLDLFNYFRGKLFNTELGNRLDELIHVLEVGIKYNLSSLTSYINKSILVKNNIVGTPIIIFRLIRESDQLEKNFSQNKPSSPTKDFNSFLQSKIQNKNSQNQEEKEENDEINSKTDSNFDFPPFFEVNHEMYELVSVLVHKGTFLNGHYMLYQRPSIYPKWLLFDDKRIRFCTHKEAIYSNYGGMMDKDHCIATHLVYIQSSKIREMMECSVPPPQFLMTKLPARKSHNTNNNNNNINNNINNNSNINSNKKSQQTEKTISLITEDSLLNNLNSKPLLTILKRKNTRPHLRYHSQEILLIKSNDSIDNININEASDNRRLNLLPTESKPKTNPIISEDKKEISRNGFEGCEPINITVPIKISPKELYAKIAEIYKMDVDELLLWYCTPEPKKVLFPTSSRLESTVLFIDSKKREENIRIYSNLKTRRIYVFFHDGFFEPQVQPDSHLLV